MAPEIEALSAILPAWVPYVNAAVPFVLYGILIGPAFLIDQSYLKKIARATFSHWSERARYTSTLGAFKLIVVMITAAVIVVTGLVASGPLGLYRHRWTLLVVALVLFEIHRRMSTHLLGIVRPIAARSSSPRGRTILREIVGQAWVVCAIFWAIMAPAQPSGALWAIIALTWSFVIWCAWGGSIDILRRLGFFAEAPEHLKRCAVEFFGDDPRGIPDVRVFDTDVANAVAHPARRTIFFTTRALEILTPSECRAVFQHEADHLREKRSETVFRMWPMVTMIPLALWRPIEDVGGWWAVFGATWGGILVSIFLAKTLQRLERHADLAVTAADQANLARALEKLHEENGMPVVFAGKGTSHPHLYDRLAALGYTPSYPRPKPPVVMPQTIVVWITVAMIAIVVTFVVLQETRSESEFMIAVTGGDARAIEGYASDMWNDHPERATVAYRALTALEAERPDYFAYLAELAARAGDLALADRHLDDARRCTPPQSTPLRNHTMRAIERASNYVERVRASEKR